MDVRGGGAGDRLISELLGCFAGLALILTAVGIYGVISYAAAQRTREIGIRLAFGAQRLHIVRLILWEGILPAGIGLGVGCLMSYPLPALFSNIFPEFHAAIMPILALVSGLIIVVMLAASYVPLSKAIHIDPNAALRYE
jgi:putative ABC transport system permease protein